MAESKSVKKKYNFSLSLPFEYPLLTFMQIGFPKFVADLYSLGDDWKFSVPEIPAVPQLNSSTGQALRLQHNGGLVEFGSPNLEGHPYCHPSTSPIPSSTSARGKEFTCFAVRTMRLVY